MIGELNGIAQQIEHDLLYSIFVSHYLRYTFGNFIYKFQIFARYKRFGKRQNDIRKAVHVQRFELQRQVSIFESGEIQNIID